MAAHWAEIATVNYTFNLIKIIIFFLSMYGVLFNLLLKRVFRQTNTGLPRLS